MGDAHEITALNLNQTDFFLSLAAVQAGLLRRRLRSNLSNQKKRWAWMRRTNRPTKFGKVSNGFATASGNTLSWLTILCPLKVCGQPKHCWLKAGWNVFYSAVPLAALPTPFLPTPHPPAQCTWWTQTELRSTVWDKDHRPKKLRRALMSMPICRNRSAFRDPESRTARKTHHEKQTN